MTREELEASYNECQVTDDYIAVAKGAAEHLNDLEWAAALLEEAAEWATMADELVLLAQTAVAIQDTTGLGGRLFAQAKDFCMTPEELETLGAAAWKAGEQEAGREAYQAVAGQLRNVADLLALAGRVGEQTGDRELAAEVEAKALARCDDAGAFVSLAETVAASGDLDRVRSIYDGAVKSAKSGADFGILAAGMLRDLKDRDAAAAMFAKADELVKDPAAFVDLGRAALTTLEDAALAGTYYRKAAEGIEDVAGLLTLAAAVRETLEDAALLADVMAAAETRARTYEEMLALADRISEILSDTDAVVRVLVKAAERTTETTKRLEVAAKLAGMGDAASAESVFGLAEDAVETGEDFRKLAEAAKDLVQDEARKTALAEQSALRQAHPDLYAGFLKVEQAAGTPGALMRLAGEVRTVVGDVHYAARLYRKADHMAIRVDERLTLARRIHGDIEDATWVRDILTPLAQSAKGDRLLSAALLSIRDLLADTAWIESLLKDRENSGQSAADFIRLARMIMEHVGDGAWAAAVLEKAAGKAASLADSLMVGMTAGSLLEEREAAEQYFRVAGEACRTQGDFYRLFTAIRSVPDMESLLKDAYAIAASRLEETTDLVFLAETVLMDFADTEQAGELYRKAESVAKTSVDIYALLRSVDEKLGDTGWSGRLRNRLLQTV